MRRIPLRTAPAFGLLLILATVLAGSAAGATEPCRNWHAEHAEHKAKVLGLHLRGASQARIDAAMFDLLQREAPLTSCGVDSRSGRPELVGWRIVGRPRGAYASAVVESVLSMAGFELDLAQRLGIGSDPQYVARR